MVFHDGIEDFLHRTRQAVELIHEEDIMGTQLGEHLGEITGAGE